MLIMICIRYCVPDGDMGGIDREVQNVWMS